MESKSKKERIKYLESELELYKKSAKGSDKAREAFSELYRSTSKSNDHIVKENEKLKQQIRTLSNKLDETQGLKSDSRLVNNFCEEITEHFGECYLVSLNESLNTSIETLSGSGNLADLEETLIDISKFNSLLSQSIAYVFYYSQEENIKNAPVKATNQKTEANI